MKISYSGFDFDKSRVSRDKVYFKIQIYELQEKDINTFPIDVKTLMEQGYIDCVELVQDSFSKHLAYGLNLMNRNNDNVKSMFELLDIKNRLCEKTFDKIIKLSQMKSICDDNYAYSSFHIASLTYDDDDELDTIKFYFSTQYKESVQSVSWLNDDYYYLNYISDVDNHPSIINDAKALLNINKDYYITLYALDCSVNKKSIENRTDNVEKTKLYIWSLNGFDKTSTLDFLCENGYVDKSSAVYEKIEKTDYSRLEGIALCENRFGEKSVNYYFYWSGKMIPGSYIKCRDDIVLRDIHGIYFLVDIHEKNYSTLDRLYCINKTGAFIWTIIKENDCHSIDDIFNILIRNIKDYDDSMGENIRKDIDSFLRQLFIRGYVLEGINNEN